VGETPEQAIQMAFELAEKPDEILERREQCRAFMTGYQDRIVEKLTQTLAQ
jgi:hypothetical protein